MKEIRVSVHCSYGLTVEDELTDNEIDRLISEKLVEEDMNQCINSIEWECTEYYE